MRRFTVVHLQMWCCLQRRHKKNFQSAAKGRTTSIWVLGCANLLNLYIFLRDLGDLFCEWVGGDYLKGHYAEVSDSRTLCRGGNLRDKTVTTSPRHLPRFLCSTLDRCPTASIKQIVPYAVMITRQVWNLPAIDASIVPAGVCWRSSSPCCLRRLWLVSCRTCFHRSWDMEGRVLSAWWNISRCTL